MNLNFLCCVGAEMKNSTQQTTRMSQIYLYRAFEDETVDEMLAPGFFNNALGIIREGDLMLLYGPDESLPRYVYARVAEVGRNGVRIEKIPVQARDVYVDLSNITNLTGDNLQQVIESIDQNITRLDKKIDDEIERAKKAEGDLNFPTITDGAEPPADLSDAIRQLNTQNITPITEDNQAPISGTWTVWGAIRKIFNNITYAFNSISTIFRRMAALEGIGGLLAPYNFGKTFTNPISSPADIQSILTYFISQIWEGATDIVFNTTDYAQTTFKDANGESHTAAEIFNATAVTNTFDNTRIQINNTQNTNPKVFEFTNQGILLVGIANTTTAGIVRAGSKSQIIVSAGTGDVTLNSSKGEEIRNTIGAAPLNSPAFTGTPTASTAPAGTSNTQLATTAFVQNAISSGTGARYLVSKKEATAADPSWYNIYSDGWVEQGGIWTGDIDIEPNWAEVAVVYFLIPMRDTLYTPTIVIMNEFAFQVSFEAADTTLMKPIFGTFGGTHVSSRKLTAFRWSICGYKA